MHFGVAFPTASLLFLQFARESKFSGLILPLSFNAAFPKTSLGITETGAADREPELIPQARGAGAHRCARMLRMEVQLEGRQHKRTKLAERQTGSKTVWETLPYLQTLPLSDEIFMGKQRKTAILTIILSDWAVLFFFLILSRILYKHPIKPSQKVQLPSFCSVKIFVWHPEQQDSSSWTESKSTVIKRIKNDTFSKEPSEVLLIRDSNSNYGNHLITKLSE